MGVMKLSVMSDLGQIQPISHHPDHLGPANVCLLCPEMRGHGACSIIRIRCEATFYVCDAPDIQTQTLVNNNPVLSDA